MKNLNLLRTLWMLPLFCLALNLHAQGVAKTKPSTSTQHLTAIPSRSNVANRLKANEYIKKGMEYYRAKNYTQAASYLEKAANLGEFTSQSVLGSMYMKGEGVPQDYQKAKYWLEKSANQQFAPAQFGLGLMYYQGLGMAKDDKKAFFWVEKAATQGNGYEQARLKLGEMYLRGEGVSQDYQKASSLLEKIATDKNSLPDNAIQAMLDLSVMYMKGEGVQDHQKALLWAEKAANLGSPVAKEVLSHLQAESVTDYLKVGNTLQFNKETYYLGWSSHPTDIYYIQEYFPKDEKAESYHQMFSVSILYGDALTPKVGADTKVAELELRKSTDACCNYKVLNNGDSYMVDFLVSQKDEKNPELLSVVEFNLYLYRQVTINGKKALELDFYSRRAYGEEIIPFLQTLTETRKEALAEMTKTDIQCH